MRVRTKRALVAIAIALTQVVASAPVAAVAPPGPGSSVGVATAPTPGFSALTLDIYDETGVIDWDVPPVIVAYPDAPAPGATPCATVIATRLDFDWGRGSPAAGCPEDDFSIYGTGTIVAPYTGTVEFCTSNDDGFYIEIGGTFAIGDWGLHGANPCDEWESGNNEGDLAMVAGQSYPVRVWFYENEAGAVLGLSWRWDGGTWTRVPGPPTTVTVSPAGQPGRVTSSDGVIDCVWDGEVTAGTCTDTTSATVVLTATGDNAADEIAWGAGCDVGFGPECTPSLSLATAAIDVTFSPPCGVLGNLVPNCGFELRDDNDELATWDVSGYPGFEEEEWGGTVRTGRYALRLDGDAVSQTFDLTAGDAYAVTAHLRRDRWADPWSRFDATLTTGGTTTTRVAVSTTTADWTAATFEFTADGPTATISFGGRWGGWYLDDVSLLHLGASPDRVLTVEPPGGGSISSGDGSIDCGGACSAELPLGTTVDLVATPDEGYEFSSWTGACTGTSPACQVDLSASRRVGARFTPTGEPFVGLKTLSLSFYDEYAARNADPFGAIVRYPTAPSAGAATCHAAEFARLEFDWRKGSPGGTCPTDYFTAYGSGTLIAPYTGIVDICTSNDDGMFVEVGAGLIVGDWGVHGADECNNEASMAMVEGHAYPIRVWYYERTDGAVMRLRWRWDGGDWAPVPGRATTVVVAPSGTPGRVTSSNGVIDCAWDGETTSGTCADTTTGSIELTGSGEGAADELAWAGACEGTTTDTCTPIPGFPEASAGIVFSPPCGIVGNLIANCGFERGTIAPWSGSGSRGLASTSWGDLVRTGASAGWLGTSAAYWQDVSVTSGERYDLRFHVAADCTTCTFEATITTNGVTTTVATLAAGSDEWTARTYRFEALGPTARVTFRALTSRWWYVDDISIAPAPPRTRHRLTVEATAGGTVAATGIDCGADCSEDVVEGTAVVLTATPAAGYELSAWTGACSATTGPTCAVTVEATTGVGVVFGRPLTVTAPSNGSISSGDGRISCAAGGGTACAAVLDDASVVTLTAIPAAGFELSAWTGACSATTGPTCAVTMSDARSAGATFGRRLTVTAPANGSISSGDGRISCGGGGSACSAVVADGASVGLTAIPAAGYELSAWTGACSASTGPTCSVTMSAARTVGAVYGRPLTVPAPSNGSLASDDGRIACGGTGVRCTAVYPDGAAVVLRMTAATGYDLSAWTGACATTTRPPCAFTMSAPRTAGATFGRRLTVTPPTVGSITSGDGRIACTSLGRTCSAVYPDGATVALTVTAPVGHSLGAWTGACSATTGPACSVPMSAARTVGATFTPWFTVVLGTPTKGKVSITARWAIPTSHPLPLTYLEILQGTGTLATKATLAYSGSLSTTGIAGTAGSVRFHLTATRGGTSVSPSVVPY